MKVYIEARCEEIGKYVVETGATCRDCAIKFGLSKETVRKDLSIRLKTIDNDLYLKVRKVLDLNKKEAYLRGGLATQERFKTMKMLGLEI